LTCQVICGFVAQKPGKSKQLQGRRETSVATDLFVLVNDRTADGADAWYDSLPAGKYDLTIQRRLACCDGPMVESNKINFEVVP
jgi:hypothetical protein